jgi:hypothetical protein
VLRRITVLADGDNVVIVGLGGGQLLRVWATSRLQVIAPADIRRTVMERSFG